MNKELLKSILKDQKNDVMNYQIMSRPMYQTDDEMNYAFVGIRRAGKSYVMYQHIRTLLAKGVLWNNKLPIEKLIKFQLRKGTATKNRYNPFFLEVSSQKGTYFSALHCERFFFVSGPIISADKWTVEPGGKKGSR